MVKVFSLFLLLIATLYARENPFFPASGELDIPMTTNQVTKIPPLKRATITFPSTVRTIESITIKYKNLDGSLVDKTVKLGNSIDWHLPLFLSQNIAMGEEKKSSKKSKKEHYKKIAGVSFISLYESKHKLKIITKDKMMRNFLLTKPHRIVCDFKRDIDIRSYEVDTTQKNSVVTRVRVGNHSGYYRVVIELDGYYSYKTVNINNGYLFKFL
jgi:hypothetical protein